MPKKASKKTTKKVTTKKIAKKTAKVSTKKAAKKHHICRITKNDSVRWNRIEDEIIVDAYGPEEQMSGWYYSIGDHIDENHVCCRCRKTRSMSPLKVGEEVDVLEIAPFEDCLSEMFVYIQWNDRKLAVPLEQLEPISGDPKAIEVIEDWLYWCLMGYEF
ncbi:MAG: calcium-binding protein [Planctomycetaceae bacterium]|jgi:hypothetical protein|nr:calcium-binding protein [Planctomycetaceae bacterium]